jgi:hypothetical protein
MLLCAPADPHTLKLSDGGSISKIYLRRRFKAKMPTSRSITTTDRISAPVESCHVYGGIFEDELDGRVEIR